MLGGRKIMKGSTAERLKQYAEILRLIDEKRELTGAPMLGYAIEQYILDSELAKL
jgi:hypothetical protein